MNPFSVDGDDTVRGHFLKFSIHFKECEKDKKYIYLYEFIMCKIFTRYTFFINQIICILQGGLYVNDLLS